MTALTEQDLETLADYLQRTLLTLTGEDMPVAISRDHLYRVVFMIETANEQRFVWHVPETTTFAKVRKILTNFANQIFFADWYLNA